MVVRRLKIDTNDELPLLILLNREDDDGPRNLSY